ncbi:MAG: NAD(+)/NADH kinase [Clostridia bacterium]
MKKIVLLKNDTKPIAFTIQDRLIEIFKNSEIEVITDEKTDEKDIDMLIILGGDGTLLYFARQNKWLNTPVLGINCGNLGFLSEVETEELDFAMNNLIKGEYHIEKRIMIDIDVDRNGKTIFSTKAINEGALTKGSLSRLTNIEVFVDQRWVDTYPSDGVIVSTPTGSTAYSLSAGGPLVSPEVSLFIITPIAPHALYARPIIISSGSSVKMKIKKANYCFLTVDGQENFKILPEDIIEFKKSNLSLKLVRIKELNFFKLMRQKLRRTEVRGE